MEIKELKLYTKNLDSYDAEQVDELEPMTDKELDEFQHEIEHGTGMTSDWDAARAIITFRKLIRDWEVYANQMKDSRDHWHDLYNQSQGVVHDCRMEIEKLENEIRNLKGLNT